MNQSLHTVLERRKCAEVNNLDNVHADVLADVMKILNLVPGVFPRLLETEGKTLVLHIDAQDNGLDILALLENLRRMLNSLGPRHVGDVDEAVNPLLQGQKGPEIRHVADPARHRGTHGVRILDLEPGIFLQLFHAQGDPLVLLVSVEDKGLNLIPHRNDLGGMTHPPRPGHLRDVNEPFHPFFELNESAVVRDADDPAHDPCVGRILDVHVFPGVVRDLLVAEADPFSLPVELQDHNLYVIADLEHLGGVSHTAPGHIGDVEEAVQSPQIDEGAVIGDVLHHAFDALPLLEGLQRFGLQRGPLVFQKRPP